MFIKIKALGIDPILYINTKYIIKFYDTNSTNENKPGLVITYSTGDYTTSIETTDYTAYNLAAILNTGDLPKEE